MSASLEPDAPDWNRILGELEPRLRTYVDRSLGERARRWTDPHDIVQRTVEEVWRSLSGAKESISQDEIEKRLFRTARSRIRDAVRNDARLAGESVLGKGGLEIVEDPSKGSVTRADRESWLRGLVDRLPPKYSEVVRCCGLEGMSFVDAAKELGLEPDTVRKRYHAARETLARKLDGRAE